MKAAHTPGPWMGSLNVDEDQFSIYPDTGKMEFPICIMPDFVKPEINTANARLIAAAPDLLEALESMLAHCIGQFACGETGRKARAPPSTKPVALPMERKDNDPRRIGSRTRSG